jgi:hypothetical protein
VSVNIEFQRDVERMIDVSLNDYNIVKEWYHGTLFVRTIDKATAVNLSAFLEDNLLTKVSLHEQGEGSGEFSFDFILEF